MEEKNPKVQVAQTARLLFERELVRSYAGSVSMRVDKKIFITPSYYPITETSLICFADAKPDHIIVTDMKGEKLEGEGNPSFESEAHIAIYKMDPSAGGVVHTHQPYATAYATAGIDLVCWTDSPRSHIGIAPIVQQRPAGSEWLAASVSEALQKRHAILTRNHGVWCKGKTLKEAYCSAEQLEEAAKTQIFAGLLRTKMFEEAARQLEKEATFLDDMYKEEARIKKRRFGIDFKYPETR